MWYRLEARCEVEAFDDGDIHVGRKLGIYTFQAENIEEATKKVHELMAKTLVFVNRQNGRIVGWDHDNWYLLQYSGGTQPNFRMDGMIETAPGMDIYTKNLIEENYCGGRSFFFPRDKHESEKEE